MSSNYRKRKHRPYENDPYEESHQSLTEPDASLFIRAHEADLVRGPQATKAARSLEVVLEKRDRTSVVSHGDGLIEWVGGSSGAHEDADFPEDHMQLGHAPAAVKYARGDAVWVDKYDARLLLDALPEFSAAATSSPTEPSSPGGWSDLPSDAEDTFFFSPDEIEDYRRDKRRRVIHEDRQARLRALHVEAPNDGQPPADPREDWGGSDEEPDEAQRGLMQRTATHVLASPNSAQLEMRILANHGADPRFAFLRGRWARAWRLMKTKIRLDAAAEKQRISEGKESAGIGGLAGYGDSDEDSNDDVHEAEEDEEVSELVIDDALAQDAPVPSKETYAPAETSDDALQAARRARAREWAEKRRVAKETDSNCQQNEP
ncbi:hypothetical protein C2E23DRAFT_833437 [Lenzites betulinus]|nr:hypothetical protein C2E23DRAFT_833437 [Lenzites betulinus]